MPSNSRIVSAALSYWNKQLFMYLFFSLVGDVRAYASLLACSSVPLCADVHHCAIEIEIADALAC